VLSSLDRVDEVILADAVPGRAADVAARIGVTAAASVAEAMATADAVLVATPTSTHAGLVHAAIELQKPTFCEKPLALELEASIDLAREIDRSGVPFQLGFQRRFDAGYREARRLVESGDLGRLFLVRLASHDPAPPPDDYLAGSGGLFRDLGIHDFDVLRWLTCSEAVEVHATGAVLAWEAAARYGDVDTAVVTMRLANGALVSLDLARHDPLGYDIRAELFGARDSVVVGLGPRTPLRNVEPGEPSPAGPAWDFFVDRFAAAYRDELDAFVSVAKGELPSPCTARDGVEALRLAEAAQASLTTGRSVRLEEIPGP
jgi:myo-inositol 2-dehydrogenase/D-chiro-inositol 1-dehydrogenase